MRVAFDEQIFAIQRYGGISRMFAELGNAFVAEPELGVELLPLSAPVINRYVLEDDALRTRLAVWDAKHEYRSLARYFTRVQPRRGQDVVHNTFYLPHGLASYPGAKRIVTIHDMIPELLPKTRRRLDFLTLKRHYVRRADEIICVSEATRNDLVRTYPDIRAPIRVIHHGVDPRFRPGQPPIEGWPDRYLLFVGNRSGYKDADVLFRAMAGLHDRDVALVCVGGGSFTAAERQRLTDLGIAERVRQQHLPDGAMAGAYHHALAFVFPSRFEGFGMPALEAMACGTPTVLAEATSLPEVGGDAAAYFPSGDAAALTAVLNHLLNDPGARAALARAGEARAATFTWHHAAVRHVEAYRQALGA